VSPSRLTRFTGGVVDDEEAVVAVDHDPDARRLEVVGEHGDVAIGRDAGHATAVVGDKQGAGRVLCDADWRAQSVRHHARRAGRGHLHDLVAGAVRHEKIAVPVEADARGRMQAGDEAAALARRSDAVHDVRGVVGDVEVAVAVEGEPGGSLQALDEGRAAAVARDPVTDPPPQLAT
jgi:hypothetical protein